MTSSKTPRWLLVSAAAFALPAVLAVWWMVSSHGPLPASVQVNEAAPISDADAPSGTPQRTADAPGGSEKNTEADDFQQYVESLRAQGLPARTVRELTASRITAAFQARRTAILGQARPGRANAAETQAQLDALGREQGALIARLVGAEEAPAENAPATSPAAGATSPVMENQFLMPAVMADALPATVKTEEQVVDWEKMRAGFVKAIGGENQDPASPPYRHRWVQAQSEADQQFRLYFGDNAFVQHQLQAQHEAMMKEQGKAK